MSADVITLRRSRPKKRSKKRSEPPEAPLPLAAEIEFFVRRIDVIPGWLARGQPADVKQAARLLAVSIDGIKRALARNSETAGKSLAHVLAITALGQDLARVHIDGACRGIRLVATLLEEINGPINGPKRPSGGDNAA